MLGSLGYVDQDQGSALRVQGLGGATIGKFHCEPLPLQPIFGEIHLGGVSRQELHALPCKGGHAEAT